MSSLIILALAALLLRYSVEKQTDRYINTADIPTHATIVGVGNCFIIVVVYHYYEHDVDVVENECSDDSCDRECS